MGLFLGYLFCSIGLYVYLHVSIVLPDYFNYYSFVMYFEIRTYKAFSFFLFLLKIVLESSGVPYEF